MSNSLNFPNSSVPISSPSSSSDSSFLQRAKPNLPKDPSLPKVFRAFQSVNHGSSSEVSKAPFPSPLLLQNSSSSAAHLSDTDSPPSTPKNAATSDVDYQTPEKATNYAVTDKLVIQKELDEKFHELYGITAIPNKPLESLRNANVGIISIMDLSFPVVQQPSLTGCGPACMLMVSPDSSVRTALTEDPWYATRGNTVSAHVMQTRLKKLGVSAKWVAFAKNEKDLEKKPDILCISKDGNVAVECIKIILNKPQTNLILGTTSKIEGHWVVINRLDNDLFILRDPYTGHGGVMNGSQLAPFILADKLCVENALLIE